MWWDLSCPVRNTQNLTNNRKYHRSVAGEGEGGTSIFVAVVMLEPCQHHSPVLPTPSQPVDIITRRIRNNNYKLRGGGRAELWLRAGSLILTCTLLSPQSSLRYFICHNSHSASQLSHKTTRHDTTHLRQHEISNLPMVSADWGKCILNGVLKDFHVVSLVDLWSSGSNY